MGLRDEWMSAQLKTEAAAEVRVDEHSVRQAEHRSDVQEFVQLMLEAGAEPERLPIFGPWRPSWFTQRVSRTIQLSAIYGWLLGYEGDDLRAVDVEGRIYSYSFLDTKETPGAPTLLTEYPDSWGYEESRVKLNDGLLRVLNDPTKFLVRKLPLTRNYI